MLLFYLNLFFHGDIIQTYIQKVKSDQFKFAFDFHDSLQFLVIIFFIFTTLF